MFNLKQYVIDLDVRNDGSVRTNCPVCKGYKTFTVTNNMGVLLWNCYKVTCDVGGRSKVRLTIEIGGRLRPSVLNGT